MAQNLGESREVWGVDIWNKAEEFANKTKATEPFYIVYAAKKDGQYSNAFRQTFKAYYEKPPKILGVLVWYVDKSLGIFMFVPELSSPPDIPVDPSLLSTKASDYSPEVAQIGKEQNVLLS